MTKYSPKKRYKGICTQEVLTYTLGVPRSTIYDYCKREGISLADGVTKDVFEKVFQHFLAEPSKQLLFDQVEFTGTFAY